MTPERADLEAAARLFRALATPSRLQLLCLLGEGRATVSQLVRRSGLSQPLVSQHLRTLRETGLVTLTRSGREAVHELADTHVGHIVADAVAHAAEPRRAHGELGTEAQEQPLGAVQELGPGA